MTSLAFTIFAALAVTTFDARALPASTQAIVTAATAAAETPTPARWDRCGIIIVNPWCR